jgi:hypothetical protein
MFINNNRSSGIVTFLFTVNQITGNGFQAALRLATQTPNLALSKKEYSAQSLRFPVEQAAALALEVELE